MDSKLDKSLKAKNAQLEKELTFKSRELEIEAALERVRSRAMAMHKTDELLDAAELLYKELTNLGIASMAVTYSLMDAEEKNASYYSINPVDGKINPKPFELPHDETEVMRSLLSSWKKKEPVNLIELDEEATLKHQTYIGEKLRKYLNELNIPFSVEEFLAVSPKKAVIYTFNFAQGYIFIIGDTRLTKEQEEMVLRFTKVFELTYRRFLDLKQAEEQARESQIQLALERVRARTMAMQRSEELHEVIQLVFDQLQQLNFSIDTANFTLNYSETDDLDLWIAVAGARYATKICIPYFNHPLFDRFNNAKTKGGLYADTLSVEERNSFFKHFFKHAPKVTDERQSLIFNAPGFARSAVFMKNIVLTIINYRGAPYSETENTILLRFGQVFDQTYTRFNDLKQAEEQAREAQIQLALERVRARTMAMQKSEELAETVFILFQQFKELGENPDQATIGIVNEEEHVIEYWVTMHGEQTNRVFKFSIDEPNVTHKIYKAWKAKKKSLVIDLAGKELLDFMTYRAGMGGARVNKAEKRRIINVAFFSKGLINVQSNDTRSEESVRLLERFAGVFDGTYTRFLDLKQAEAQAREAQMQLALERVRARTMAMQKSKELAETVSILFKQLLGLGIPTEYIRTCGIVTFDASEPVGEQWITEMNGNIIPRSFMVDYDEAPAYKTIYQWWKQGRGFEVNHLEGEALQEHLGYLSKYTKVPLSVLTEESHEIYNHILYFSQGYLFIITRVAMTEYHEVFRRFGSVFQQSYTRFLDLQKAEGQARESQIQLALERVRARTMAMQKSEELSETAAVLFQQFKELGEDPIQITIGLINEAESNIEFWATDNAGNKIDRVSSMSIDEPNLLNKIYKAWKERQRSTAIELSGKELMDWVNYRSKLSGIIDNNDYSKARRNVVAAFFSNGLISLSTPERRPPEVVRLLERFAGVFDGTYTRFLDLKQAEAQAREAQIQLGLERVRAKAMAMRSSEELNPLVGSVFEELTKLDFVLNRALIMIFDPETLASRWWMANSEVPEEPANYLVQNHDNPAYLAYLKAWHERILQWQYALKGKVKRDWDDFLFVDTELSRLPEVVIEGMKAPETVLLTASFNNFGCLTLVSMEPLSAEHSDILLRFAKVFDMSYTRFNDLKQAEAQARESQIQLALERVRARTMAMQHSEELAETATVLFRQLHSLDIAPERVFISIPREESRIVDIWGTEPGGKQMSTRFEADTDATWAFRQVRKGWEEKKPEFAVVLKGKHLEEHINQVINQMHIPFRKELAQGQRILYCTYFSKGFFVTITPEAQPEETRNILQRFAAVFDQTYTRFLDLQRAEAQAREGRIQLGLERVRAAAMAMHDSTGVGDATALVFTELYKLGIGTIRCGVCIIDGSAKEIEVWSASQQEGKISRGIGRLDMTAHPLWVYLLNAWKDQKSSFVYELKGKELTDYYHIIRNAAGYQAPDNKAMYNQEAGVENKTQYCNCYIFKEGCLFTFTHQPFSYEAGQVLEKFAAVFGLTYRRYLDLQRAEAQVREAQIEAALERVRSKTMAMHNSNDVADTVGVMFNELIKLGVEKLVRCGIGILKHNSSQMEVWTAKMGENEKTELIIGHFGMGIHKMLAGIYNAWENQEPSFSYVLEGDDMVNYFEAINNEPDYPMKYVIDKIPSPQYHNDFIFAEGVLFTFTPQPLSGEISSIFKRFAGVFGQTYRRYLDLRKAEANAREAQIEAALERVRAKAMAMRTSDDLNATANTVFIELRKLGVDLVRCGVGLLEKQSHISTIHAATNSAEGASLEVLGKLNLEAHPVLVGIYKHWRQNEDYFPVLEGKSLRDYYKKLRENGISVPELKKGEKQYGYFFQFPDGCLYAWSGEQESETTIRILKRFTSVVGLTYTRYMELQKAESNAREAIKQASLDRVRAEIASMRKRSDLERITPLIWDELTILGIPFIRCGVFIVDEEQKLIHTFLSTPDGKAIGAFHVPFDASENFEQIVSNWQNKTPYIDHWKEDAFSQFADTLLKQGAITSKAQYMRTLPHEGIHLNFLPFLQGMLYVGNAEPLAEDNISLIQAVAAAFSTAYARYEDFNKLEAAKQQVDNTLTQLKSTQTKLIQSEKMASLGELTAGIAHEIQNPLNFVNNFSEVSAELIDEMGEELDKGDIEEAKAIAVDIKENLQKIRHHGGRADGIVKGMLQHSRASSDVKEPTDMNKLADEYLRLAYHGLRAKNKEFNAELVTHFDNDLPKPEVVPQDIGRVLINLYNNAFYATQQRASVAKGVYKPEVTVTTSAIDGLVTISVKDNGNGIPESIKDKIMQPFFTTKPTGEGTGLGLSLSYDIVVKGHDGKIDVQSKENEFTEFTVSLPIN